MVDSLADDWGHSLADLKAFQSVEQLVHWKVGKTVVLKVVL
jgi:hypothetical protein